MTLNYWCLLRQGLQLSTATVSCRYSEPIFTSMGQRRACAIMGWVPNFSCLGIPVRVAQPVIHYNFYLRQHYCCGCVGVFAAAVSQPFSKVCHCLSENFD